MSNTGIYYALTLNATGTTTDAYFSLTPTSDLQISQGGVTFTPTAVSTTLANIYPSELQIQSPPGMVNAGVTIVSDAPVIGGRLSVSPPVSVETVVTLFGVGGMQLGQFILDAEVGNALFSFDTTPNTGMSEGEAISVVQKLMAKK